MKATTRWFSERLGEEATLVRWGWYGVPVLLFPTAGGDAEEVERFHLIAAVRPLIDAGRIKVYSCDSVGGQWLVSGNGSPRLRARMQDLYQQYVHHEVVPAIRNDCQSPDIDIVTTGASIGAFHALAVICRFPQDFSAAVCMSGTYDIGRFVEGATSKDLYDSTAVHFLPNLNGDTLARLKQRFVVLASGEGRAEDIGESWRAAHVLGSKGVPNRVDPWGPEWDHDWETWRRMLPQYLAEFSRQGGSEQKT